jgi:hypothetical protein
MPYGQQAYSRVSNNATYGCTALVGTNKAGVLAPNPDGYYKVVLGGLNVYNSGGAYYPYNDDAKRLFDESSTFMRRVASGTLRGEMGHPRMLPGMSERQFMSRVMDILETNVCCHIRSVTLDFDNVRDNNGNKIIAIIGEITPSGPMGPALKASLDNPSENVCFSIRSITNDVPINGILYKNLKSIIGWDCVNEPGLANSTKWKSPSLESYGEERKLSPVQLQLIVDNTKRMRSSGVSMESHDFHAEQVFADLGWDRPELILPLSARW